MRAGLYVRISRDIAGQGLGVQRQEEDCRGHAETLGWEVAEVYVDNDVSATSGRARPAYQRMLDDLRRGDLTAIVAWHPDRLYRKVTDLAELVEVCKSTNAQVATVNASHVDLSSPTGRMVAGILAQVAMYEVEHKSERWSRSWRQGRERGVPVTNSNRLFGYARDGQTIIDPEAAVIRELADRLLAGETLSSLLRDLDRREVRTTLGNVWRQQGLKGCLLNPRLAGLSTHRGEVLGEGEWEPILDRDTWESLRALLNSRNRPRGPRKYVLNGILFCGKCGYRMVSGNDKGHGMYRCPKRPHMPGCGGVSVRSAHVEEIVETAARLYLEDPAVRRRVAQLRAEPSGAQNELVDLDNRIRELEHQLDEPGVPVPTILRAIDRAKERQTVLLDKIAAVPRTPLPESGGAWPEDLKRRRALIDLAIARVDVAPSAGGNKFRPERVKITRRDAS
jgi:site-specific DNA recombinase